MSSFVAAERRISERTYEAIVLLEIGQDTIAEDVEKMGMDQQGWS